MGKLNMSLVKQAFMRNYELSSLHSGTQEVTEPRRSYFKILLFLKISNNSRGYSAYISVIACDLMRTQLPRVNGNAALNRLIKFISVGQKVMSVSCDR